MKTPFLLRRWLLATGAVFALQIAAANAAEQTFQFFRFTPDKLRDAGANSIQLAEFQFRLANAPISTAGVTVTNPLGNFPAGEPPSALIDNNTGTKWLDFNKSYVQFEFPAPVTIDAYNFATANDAPERDPVSWTFSGSSDGENWEPLHIVVDYPTTTERFTYQTPFALPAAISPVISSFTSTPTVVLNGEPVELSWTADFANTVTLDTGAGPVEVAESDFQFFVPPGNTDVTAVLSASIPGETVTAQTTLRSVAGGPVSYRYVRFTPVKLRNSAAANSIQLSEFFFLDGFGTVPVESAQNPFGNTPGAEGVENLIDNTVSTKWLDFNRSEVIFDFGSIQQFDQYGFATANDGPERDPVRWLLEGRNTESGSWELIENMTAFDFPTPSARQVYTQDIPLPGSSLEPVVLLTGDTTSLLPGQPLTLTYRASGATSVSADQGLGTLPLSGVLELTPTETTTYTFTAVGGTGKTATASFTVTLIPQPEITTIAYENFNQAGAELALLGTGTRAGIPWIPIIVNDPTRPFPGDVSRLRLTPDEGSLGGTAWFRYRQDVAEGFETTFDLHFTTLGTTSGADGMAFVVQNHPGGITASPAAGHENGLTINALNIKFDSYQNEGEPSAAVVQVRAGQEVLATVDLAADERFTFPGTDPDNMTDDTAAAPPYRVRVVYRPGDLDVYMTVAPAGEIQIIDSLDVDLGEIGAMNAAGTSIVGFTARTGGAFEAHDITRWYWGIAPPPPGSLTLVSHSFDFAGDQLNLTWNSTPGRTYRVTTTTDFSGWLPVQSGITATGETTSVSVGFTQGPRAFFRVEEE